MHPSAVLLIWLAGIVATQFFGYPGLLALGLCALLSAPIAWRKWLAYVRRARWLLLTLWLILAYNTAGEAWFDQSWAPTYEGVGEANLNAVRLLAVLACLAALLGRLGRQGLLSGLWGLLMPWRRCGLDGERLVVRLALVMESIEDLPARSDWRQMLAQLPEAGEDGVMQLRVVAWQKADYLMLALGWLLLLGVSLW